MGGQCQTRYVIEERWEGGNSYCGVCVESLLRELKHGGGFFENGIVIGGYNFFKARPN